MDEIFSNFAEDYTVDDGKEVLGSYLENYPHLKEELIDLFLELCQPIEEPLLPLDRDPNIASTLDKAWDRFQTEGHGKRADHD